LWRARRAFELERRQHAGDVADRMRWRSPDDPRSAAAVALRPGGSITRWAKAALERNTSELAEIDQHDLHLRWGGRCYFPTQLIHALIRPALGDLLLDVQESVLSEAEAGPAQDLKLFLDERSLGLV